MLGEERRQEEIPAPSVNRIYTRMMLIPGRASTLYRIYLFPRRDNHCTPFLYRLLFPVPEQAAERASPALAKAPAELPGRPRRLRPMELSVRPAGVGSAHARPASILSPLTVAPIAHPLVLHPVLMHGLQLFPLVRLQLHSECPAEKAHSPFPDLCALTTLSVAPQSPRGRPSSAEPSPAPPFANWPAGRSASCDGPEPLLITLRRSSVRFNCFTMFGLFQNRPCANPNARSMEAILPQSRSHAWAAEALARTPNRQPSTLPLPPKPVVKFSVSSLVSPPCVPRDPFSPSLCPLFALCPLICTCSLPPVALAAPWLLEPPAKHRCLPLPERSNPLRLP